MPRKRWNHVRSYSSVGTNSPTGVLVHGWCGRKRGAGTDPYPSATTKTINPATFTSVARPIRWVSKTTESGSVRHTSRSLTTDGNVPPPFDVVVVGAGWAGLAALDRLAQAGRSKTTILEARDYIGGRTRTARRTSSPEEIPVELGAEWVYADTSVHRILDRLQIPYGVTKYELQQGYTALYLDRSFRRQTGRVGAKLAPQEMETLLDKNWYGPNGFLTFAQNRAKSMSSSGHADTNFEQLLRDYFSQTSGELFTLLDRQVVLGLTHSEISNEYASPLRQASVQGIASQLDEESWSMSYMGVPGGGYDRLIASLAEPYSRKQIQLQSTVTAIRYGTNPGELAHVTYTDQITGSTKTLTALAVLVTVPLGVLQAGDIVFTPPLPPVKQSAIQAIGFGTLNKCIMYWQDDNIVNAADHWWPDDSHSWLNLITATEQTAGAWTTFFNPCSVNGGTRILTGFVSGDDANAMVHQTDEQVVVKVLTNLRTMLGTTVPEPTHALVTRWNQDEFAKGSYSFPSAEQNTGLLFGSDAAARVELGRPVGSNLFFAGEATDVEWYGTTAGAYDSGIRAGDEIIAQLTSA